MRILTFSRQVTIYTTWFHINNVAYLINALPGNSSVNTIAPATVEQAVFSVCTAVVVGVTHQQYVAVT
jgi:hypothetical protein